MYNMSILDGITRLFLGCIIGGVCGAFGLWIGLITPYFIVTGMGGYCPVYHLLGWSTLEDPETNEHHYEDRPTQSLNSNRNSENRAA